MSRLIPTAEDYDADYRLRCSTNGGAYSWDNPTWRDFFTNAARQLVSIGRPIRTALDIGCANGLLVKALVDEGVDARGIDLAPSIIDDAPADIRDRLTVASATTAIEGSYDLVTCIEVLEHMEPRDAQTAIDNMAGITDRLVFTSTPVDFNEPTHINVRPTADWAADFFIRGLFRRTDIDLSFITPWAVYLERGEVSTRDVVHRYETLLSPLTLEVAAKRQGLLDAQRELARLDSGAAITEAREQLARTRNELLLLRDHVVTQEAAIANARVEVARLEHALATAQDDLEGVRSSQRWRVGGAIVAPASAVKRRTMR